MIKRRSRLHKIEPQNYVRHVRSRFCRAFGSAQIFSQVAADKFVLFVPGYLLACANGDKFPHLLETNVRFFFPFLPGHLIPYASISRYLIPTLSRSLSLCLDYLGTYHPTLPQRCLGSLAPYRVIVSTRNVVGYILQVVDFGGDVTGGVLEATRAWFGSISSSPTV